LLNGPLPTSTYGKSSYLGDTALSYKLVKCESKLVRSTLEAHGFSLTEGHDWNLLWVPMIVKPYYYEGLNEY